MSRVIIHHDSSCSNIGYRTHQIVAALENDRDFDVLTVEGKHGEFSVETNGHIVARNIGDLLPSTLEVVAAIRNETSVGSSSSAI